MARSVLSAAAPTVAIEIARHRVSAALIVMRDSALAVAAHAVEPLPAGAVAPSLNAPNIVNPRAVGEALKRVLDRIGARPKRIALAIPDSAAKVSLLKFEKVPARAADLEELVRWQVRKAVPFAIEKAQLSYVPAMQSTDGSEFVVVIARRDIVQEYESVCSAVGAQAGIVDLATFNVINAVLAGPGAPADDWLLVHVTPEDATMAILRGQQLVFFRNHAGDGEGSLADMVHQTAMYYEDRLSGAGFSRVLLAGAGSAASASLAPGGIAGADDLRRALEQRLSARVDQVDPRQAANFTDRITAGSELLDVLAPLVGLMVRERAA